MSIETTPTAIQEREIAAARATDRLYDHVLPAPYDRGQSVRSAALVERVYAGYRPRLNRERHASIRYYQAAISAAGADAGPPNVLRDYHQAASIAEPEPAYDCWAGPAEAPDLLDIIADSADDPDAWPLVSLSDLDDLGARYVCVVTPRDHGIFETRCMDCPAPLEVHTSLDGAIEEASYHMGLHGTPDERSRGYRLQAGGLAIVTDRPTPEPER